MRQREEGEKGKSACASTNGQVFDVSTEKVDEIQRKERNKEREMTSWVELETTRMHESPDTIKSATSGCRSSVKSTTSSLVTCVIVDA